MFHLSDAGDCLKSPSSQFKLSTRQTLMSVPTRNLRSRSATIDRRTSLICAVCMSDEPKCKHTTAGVPERVLRTLSYRRSKSCSLQNRRSGCHCSLHRPMTRSPHKRSHRLPRVAVDWMYDLYPRTLCHLRRQPPSCAIGRHFRPRPLRCESDEKLHNDGMSSLQLRSAISGLGVWMRCFDSIS